MLCKPIHAVKFLLRILDSGKSWKFWSGLRTHVTGTGEPSMGMVYGWPDILLDKSSGMDGHFLLLGYFEVSFKIVLSIHVVFSPMLMQLISRWTQDGYSTLASLTSKKQLRLFKMRPKLHMFCHLQSLISIIQWLLVCSFSQWPYML